MIVEGGGGIRKSSCFISHFTFRIAYLPFTLCYYSGHIDFSWKIYFANKEISYFEVIVWPYRTIEICTHSYKKLKKLSTTWKISMNCEISKSLPCQAYQKCIRQCWQRWTFRYASLICKEVRLMLHGQISAIDDNRCWSCICMSPVAILQCQPALSFVTIFPFFCLCVCEHLKTIAYTYVLLLPVVNVRHSEEQ